MATQQGAPSRPWFRLATMARPPPSAPTPQPPSPPQPRPPFIRPAFTQAPPPPQPPANAVAPQPSSPTLPKDSRPVPPSSNPRTPPLQPSLPPSAVATSSPPSRSTAPSLTATMAPTINRAATPTSSPPKTVKPLEKTSPPSPNIKPLSHPPSPLALPSPQLKSYHAPQYDQKSVLVQETKEKPKANLNNGDLRRHMAPDTHNPINGAPKKPEASKNHLDSEDLGMTIITISGENKGAIMDFTPFGNKTHKFGNNPHSLHMKKDNPTASSDGDKSGTNSDGKSKAKNKNQKSKSPLITTAVMNSNVQGVNNSILYNCSTTHHDPGIHLSLSRKPSGGHRFLLKDHIN
ncbi:proline-rich receptor-like protein kinase PERK2 [Cynara cardunculus var. scolymus]|uniref:proline-rich receptor-like protein kinase PERK2 n=1 Tax=Cynara cardunculus var. scolymus TaxID=59895 RepID=UPI000D623F2B|nr:proline-rich receptor-like protein kinase PERK2 [Cynara cardunculus var. scolymus]